MPISEREGAYGVHCGQGTKIPPDGCINNQGDCADGVKKKLKTELVQDCYIPYKFNGDSDSD